MKFFLTTGLCTALLVAGLSFVGVAPATAAELPAGASGSETGTIPSTTKLPISPRALTVPSAEVEANGLVMTNSPGGSSAVHAKFRVPQLNISSRTFSPLTDGAVVNACILSTCGENTLTAIAEGPCWATDSCENTSQVDACVLAHCELSSTSPECSSYSPCVTACVISSCSPETSSATPADPRDTSDTGLAGTLGSTGDPGNTLGSLAFTGANAVPLLGAGVILLLLGGAGLLAAKRRHAIRA